MLKDKGRIQDLDTRTGTKNLGTSINPALNSTSHTNFIHTSLHCLDLHASSLCSTNSIAQWSTVTVTGRYVPVYLPVCMIKNSQN